jgi:hypothetical protein
MTSDQIDMVIRDYLALGPEGRRTDPRASGATATCADHVGRGDPAG